MKRKILVAIGIEVCLCSLSLPAMAETAQRIAFFGFNLINTSLEPTSPAEENRLQELDVLLRQKLAGSQRYDVVKISPEIQAALAAESEIQNCNGCERDLARKADAELAAWGTVQKVSNLILNINLYIEDVQTGQMAFVKSVDIRGNTDESWQHGLTYLLRYYLLGDSK
jgi:hypothetical protein